jgi:hypothetical protein
MHPEVEISSEVSTVKCLMDFSNLRHFICSLESFDEDLRLASKEFARFLLYSSVKFPTKTQLTLQLSKKCKNRSVSGLNSYV